MSSRAAAGVATRRRQPLNRDFHFLILKIAAMPS